MEKKNIVAAVGIPVVYLVDRLAAIDGALNTIKRVMDLQPETITAIQNTLHVLTAVGFIYFFFFIYRTIISFERKLNEFRANEDTFTKEISVEVAIIKKAVSENKTSIDREISVLNDSLGKQYDYFRNDDSEIRAEFRKKDAEMDAKFYNKIYALKVFRDKEIVRITDHYNAQLKTFEDRMKIIQDTLKGHDITISISDKVELTDPNAIRNEKENDKSRIQEIKAYNEAFADWKIGDYGTGDNQTIYKGKEFVA